MDIATCRFGRLAIEPEDVIRFPAGILGLEDCTRWVLLADAQNDALGWLQSLERPEVALAVVAPRRFVPDYQVRVARRELEPLQFERVEDARVLVIVGKAAHCNTLNLRAPLVFNIERRLASQVVARGDLPLQYELPQPTLLKKSA